MSETIYRHRLIITCAVDAQKQANDAAVSVVGEAAGRRTFIAPLSSNGTTATHYVSNWAMTLAQKDALLLALAPLITLGSVKVYDASEYDAQGDPKAPLKTVADVLSTEKLAPLAVAVK